MSRMSAPCVVHERGHRVAVDVAGTGFSDASRFDVAAAVFGQRVRLNRVVTPNKFSGNESLPRGRVQTPLKAENRV